MSSGGGSRIHDIVALEHVPIGINGSQEIKLSVDFVRLRGPIMSMIR